MRTQDWNEAIDACRYGSDDLSRPELAPLAEALEGDPEVRQTFERSQQLDAQIAVAFGSVPVPRGLAERLREQLEQALDADAPRPAPADSSRGSGRWRTAPRRIVVGASAAVVAAILLLGWHFVGSQPLSPARLADETAGWLPAALAQERDWSAELATAPQDPYPRQHLAGVLPSRWFTLSTALDRRTVLYDLTPAGSGRVLLFAARPRGSCAVAAAPLTVLSSTGGWTVGAWQQSGTLYVLAVEGSERRLRSFIRASHVG